MGGSSFEIGVAAGFIKYLDPNNIAFMNEDDDNEEEVDYSDVLKTIEDEEHLEICYQK